MYVRSQSKTRSGIGEIECEDGTLTSDSKIKAEIFNKFFCSVFTKEGLEDVPTLEERPFKEELSDMFVTQDKVQKLLLSLNVTKSPGEDQIHPRVLKECAPAISYFLTSLFSKSIQQQ